MLPVGAATIPGLKDAGLLHARSLVQIVPFNIIDLSLV
jgi:hypothetical protein